jgi:GNAT superfamily N-acetyltransferase
MTMHANIPSDGGLGAKAAIRRVTIDEMAAIRHIHSAAFRVYAGPYLTAEETAAYLSYISSARYTDDLMRADVYGAVINDQLVGTAAWRAGDDQGASARISAVFVDPLFTGTGLGSRLVADVEARAHQSGFKRFATRVTVNGVPFFERLGYEIASQGVSQVAMPLSLLPVTFMRKAVPVLLEVSDVAAAVPQTVTRH